MGQAGKYTNPFILSFQARNEIEIEITGFDCAESGAYDDGARFYAKGIQKKH